MKPRLEALSDEMVALRRERSILIKAVECKTTHITQDVLIDPSQAESTQALGQGKESDGHEAEMILFFFTTNNFH